MIIVYNPESYRLHEKQIIQFEKLYEDNFPDVNEREDFQFIKTRIVNPSFMENAKSFLVMEGASGLVVEYYASASSLFLTYIVIEPKARNKGVARKLVYEGISQVRDIVSEHSGKTVEAVFFEVNDPCATKIDAFDPWVRLEVFRKMGARYIDLSYVQPSLGEGKSRVNNLFLCCFPDVVNSKNYLDTATIVEFLAALYKDLGIGNPDLDPDFLKMKQELERIDRWGRHFLGEIPRRESARIKFKRAAVALHFPFTGEEDSSGENCPFFGSFEKDLFSYRFQRNVPFQTRCLTPYDPIPFSLKFPAQFRYMSEGRHETVLSQSTGTALNAYGLLTRFSGSKHGVCTLVLQPRDYLTEDDLVKLCSLFGSSQENSNLGDELWVENKGEKAKFRVFAEKIFAGFGVKNIDFSLLTGTVNIDLKYAELTTGEEFDWASFLTDIHALNTGDEAAVKKFQTVFRENDGIEKHIASAFCGIAQGIFDYARMGFSEFSDTLSVTNSSTTSFSLVNRGNLMGVAHEDPLLAVSYPTIGISPYLVLPNIVLTYSEMLLNRGLAVFEKTVEAGDAEIAKLEKALAESEEIEGGMLPQVFQYQSEKDLVVRGSEERNLNEMKEEWHRRKVETESQLERLFHRRKGRFDLYITVLLTVISIFQLEGLIRAVVEYSLDSGRGISQVEIVESAAIFVLVVAVSVAIWLSGSSAFFKRR